MYMKKLIVSRKKVFAGSLLPYWIIVGFSKVIFMQKYNYDGDLCEMSAVPFQFLFQIREGMIEYYFTWLFSSS